MRFLTLSTIALAALVQAAPKPWTTISKKSSGSCSTAYGSSSVSPVPRTTTESITHSHTTSTVTTTITSTYTTETPTTIAVTDVETLTAFVTVTTGTTTTASTVTVSSVCSAATDLEKRRVAKPPKSYPTMVECMKMTTLLTITFTTTTETAVATVTAPETVTSTSEATVTITEPVTIITTSTVTPTTTIIVNPEGAQFAEYGNPFGNDNDENYTAFNPTYFKTEQPNFQNFTYEVSGITAGGGNITPYGSSYAFNYQYFVLNHKFYLLAPQNGTYTINVYGTDDIIIIWVGGLAYSGWTRDNADLIHSTLSKGPKTFTFTAADGDYIPIRIILGQAGGPVNLSLELLAPDGTVLLDPNPRPSQNIIQFSCDGQAPPFEPFGAEN